MSEELKKVRLEVEALRESVELLKIDVNEAEKVLNERKELLNKANNDLFTAELNFSKLQKAEVSVIQLTGEEIDSIHIALDYQFPNSFIPLKSKLIKALNRADGSGYE